jgi:hypothetical protein
LKSLSKTDSRTGDLAPIEHFGDVWLWLQRLRFLQIFLYSEAIMSLASVTVASV